MQLPDENTITLPDTNEEWLAISDESPPAEIWDTDALLRFLPAYARKGTMALRDTLLKAWGTMADWRWAETTRILAAQQSPRAAWGFYLDQWGAERKIARQPDETEAEYRARLLAPWEGITPQAIVTALQAICEPSGTRIYFQEPYTHGMFASGPTSSWIGFSSGGARLWGVDPTAPSYVRAAGYTGGAPYAPRLRIFLKQSAPANELGVFASGTSLDPTSTSYASGPTLGYLGFTVRGSSLDDRLISDLVSRIAAGVHWTIYFDELA